MNRDDITEMALVAGATWEQGAYVLMADELERFAHLIAEDCAKRCEALCLGGIMDMARAECAEAIREAYKP